jgi:hypothetical protein
MMATSALETRKRPSGLVYAVDEWPPPARLAMLGFQYAVMAAMYLVLVVIILRHARVAPELVKHSTFGMSGCPLFTCISSLAH